MEYDKLSFDEMVEKVNEFISKFEMTKDQDQVFNGVREELLEKIPEGLKIRDRIAKATHTGKAYRKIRELVDTLDKGLTIHPMAAFTDLVELQIFSNGVKKSDNQKRFNEAISDIKGSTPLAEKKFKEGAAELLKAFEPVLDDIERSSELSLRASLEALDVCRARGIQFQPHGTQAKLNSKKNLGRKK